jgi:hypothetical protein
VYPELEVALFRYRNGGSLLVGLPEGLGAQNSVFLDFLDRCEWKNEEDAAINLSG